MTGRFGTQLQTAFKIMYERFATKPYIDPPNASQAPTVSLEVFDNGLENLAK
jgi:hypothetical protein